jgi:hypothetical protein
MSVRCFFRYDRASGKIYLDVLAYAKSRGITEDEVMSEICENREFAEKANLLAEELETSSDEDSRIVEFSLLIARVRADERERCARIAETTTGSLAIAERIRGHRSEPELNVAPAPD